MTCADCGQPIRVPADQAWFDTPSDDERLDRRDTTGHPIRRRILCAAQTPDRAVDNHPRPVPGYCYDPARHRLWAGTNRTGWVLVNDR